MQNLLQSETIQGRGFSGLENPLFAKPNCGMLYGDAKETLTHLVQAALKA